jgi:hypothetical protein
VGRLAADRGRVGRLGRALLSYPATTPLSRKSFGVFPDAGRGRNPAPITKSGCWVGGQNSVVGRRKLGVEPDDPRWASGFAFSIGGKWKFLSSFEEG